MLRHVFWKHDGLDAFHGFFLLLLVLMYSVNAVSEMLTHSPLLSRLSSCRHTC